MGLLGWLFGSLVRAKPVVEANADGDDDVIWEDAGRGRVKKVLADYPDDHVIYLDAEVVGIPFRKQDVFKWADGRRLSLDWQREPDNEHDRNALMVFGLSVRGRAQLGYVPREIAAQIATSGMMDRLQPRLTRIFQAPSDVGDPFCEVAFQVTGPKELKGSVS